MKKICLLLAVCLMALSLSGCSGFYDKVATPVYKGVKSGVVNSDINPETKARLKKIADKVETADAVRDTIKKDCK